MAGMSVSWKSARDAIHGEVCEKGFDAKLNSFVQWYGSPHLDASLLMIPLIGFLPADDPRVRGTVAAIEERLVHDKFVRRYDSDEDVEKACRPARGPASLMPQPGLSGSGDSLLRRSAAPGAGPCAVRRRPGCTRGSGSSAWTRRSGC